MPWYVVHTNAAREEFARDMLRGRKYPVLYPHYVAMVRHARGEQERVRPKYPRYLFAHVEFPLSIYGVNTCPGVSTVLRTSGGPIVINEAAMDEVRKDMLNEDGLCQAPTPEERVRWKQGQAVRIVRGPFEGFLATVGLDSGIAVQVWMSAFGGKTPATMPADWVRGVG